MKKFLFTLATLLMAGSVYAGNVYIADREFTAEEIGTNVWLDVMVQLDNEYINGWDFAFEFPEGLTVTSSIKKNNAVLKQTAVTNEFGDEEDVSFTVNGDAYHTAAFCAQEGFFDPDGDGEYESYGAVKIGPTGEFMLYQIRVTPTEEFKGGNIVITWMYSGGFDNRNGQTKVQQNGVTEVALTVAGGQEPEQTEMPVITVEDNAEGEYLMISATGEGTVKLYIDGMQVSNPFQYNYQDEEHEIVITATAQEEGKEISETAEMTYTVPAKTQTPPEPQVTEKPVITYFVDMDAQTVTITATGAGTVILYNDDVEVARGEGEAVYVVPFTEDPEGEEMGFSATAQEEGKEVSEYARATIEIPGKQPVQYETPAPEVTVTETEDALVLTATGEGTVTVYVQYIDNETGEMTTETYTGEGTVTVNVERGEETYYINYWAVAQANEDAVPGTTAVEYFVEVPAKEQVVPGDEHNEGVWIVTYLADGSEQWDRMIKSNDDYTCIVRFSYGNYGGFDYDPSLSMAENDMNRPDQRFYIVIDGVRYGAVEGDGTVCVLGTAMSNPIEVNDNEYVLEHARGRVYNMGVAFNEYDLSQPMYVYAAVAAYTEVEEINAGKAVAGVRYYNMAGQEMQEANGMTIVVTTYTDGTTSAVKVMK